MVYRLICIYESRECESPKIRIEINHSGMHSSLAPFIRKVSLLDLYRNGVDTSPEILTLLDHAGMQSQPFYLPSVFLGSNAVRYLLYTHSYNYLQIGGKGSVKKIPSPIHNSIGESQYLVGHLIGGELYIDRLSTWKTNLRVRILYDDSLNSFYPQYSNLPYLTVQGILYQRDCKAEEKLLSSLGIGYNYDKGILTLKDYDISFLEKLSQNGWKVYVASSTKKYSQVFAHCNKSGITWFSTEENVSTAFLQQLLDGFLKSRNYQEYNGNIAIFKKEDVLRIDNCQLTKELGAPFKIDHLFGVQIELTSIEIRNIERLLAKQLYATLRSYQLEGVKWLSTQRKNRHGCLLADEMGLGKTIQIIAYLCTLKSNLKHLIIAPTSLIYNWTSEVMKFAPSLMLNLTFVSYDMLRIHIDQYIHINYDTIVIDEAQIIKNRQTKKYNAIAKLKSQYKIILTGTPIENSIDELWSHFLILIPELHVVYKILQNKGVQASIESYVLISTKLLKPFVLRRTVKDVLKDLPGKTVKNIFLELSDKERNIYNQLHTAIQQAFISGVSGRVTSIALEGLLRLRQACVSVNLLPQNLSKSGSVDSTKLSKAVEYIRQFKLEGHKVLIFSQFVSALHELESKLEKENIIFVTLYGNTLRRAVAVEHFQKDKRITAFLISLKAGGVGLNLTRADRIILLDDWWNPAVEDQAMGRAHRIGQKNKVMVFRLICKDTVEEKILELQSKKRHISDIFNGVADKLTLEDIKKLLG